MPRTQDTPSRWCPVCDARRSDVAAIKEHNERCAGHGERSYRWR